MNAYTDDVVDQSSKIPLYHDDDDDDDDYATREKDLVEKIGRLLNNIVLGSVSKEPLFHSIILDFLHFEITIGRVAGNSK